VNKFLYMLLVNDVINDVCTTGERCDIAINDSFATENITHDVIDRDDDTFKPSGKATATYLYLLTIEERTLDMARILSLH